jgi:S-adenosylmethionine decarboxylase
MSVESPPLGRHIIVELCDCPLATLADADLVERALVAAAERSGATILGHRFHRFAPHGVSGVVIIAESHLTIHTWPEHGYAAVDIFTCGPAMQPERAVEALVEALAVGTCHTTELPRGKHAHLTRAGA